MTAGRPDPSQYEVEIEPNTAINTSIQPQLSVHTHSSCPELAQIAQILSLSENQLHSEYVKKLILMNTNVLPAAGTAIQSQSIDQPASTDPARRPYCVYCSPGHRVLKSVSQVEPLSLIEKVREVRQAVQKTLNCRFKDTCQRLTLLTEQEQKSTRIQFPDTKVAVDTRLILVEPADQPLQLHTETYSNEWSQVSSTYDSGNLSYSAVESALRRAPKSRGLATTSSTQIMIAHRRRRTKSLGLLQFSDQLAGVNVDTGRPMYVSGRSHRLGYGASAGVGGGVGRLSLIHQSSLGSSGVGGVHLTHATTGGYVGRLLVEQLHSTCPSANGRPGFSSSPSIKCDIVEYL